MSDFGTVLTAKGCVVLTGDQRWQRGEAHSKLYVEKNSFICKILQNFSLRCMEYPVYQPKTSDFDRAVEIGIIG